MILNGIVEDDTRSTENLQFTYTIFVDKLDETKSLLILQSIGYNNIIFFTIKCQSYIFLSMLVTNMYEKFAKIMQSAVFFKLVCHTL